MIINTLIFERLYDDFMILRYDTVMITNCDHNFVIILHNDHFNKTYKNKWHILLALVSIEKSKKEVNTYVNQLASDLVIGCYFYLRS